MQGTQSSNRNSGNHRGMKKFILALIWGIGTFTLGEFAWLFFGTACLRFSTLTAPSPARFASMIRLQRTEGGLDLWDTPRGGIWTVHGEKMLPFLLCEKEADAYEPTGHEVRPGDIVLDCGANIGTFVGTALSRGAALVVAIEPAPKTLEALRRNFEREIWQGRVVIYPKGVWDHDAEMDLSLDEDNEGGNSLVLRGPGARRVRVPLTTIDELVAELKLPRVDFIKMDIEGAEKPAIKGARNTIRRFRPRMSISTEHLDDDATAIPALVATIEPRYTRLWCDCTLPRLRPHVIAFDPIAAGR